MRFSSTEIRHIVRAWAAITLAFAILNAGFSLSLQFAAALAIAGITVGLGFLLHELSHKYFAQKYGCHSEFRAFDNMLVLAIIMSFFGFVIAAPGAVFIRGHVNSARHGRISAAGPLMNLLLAAAFVALAALAPLPLLRLVAVPGAMINSWLALFNLIPFGFFDGAKVFAWNKKAYAALLLAAFALLASVAFL